MEQENKLIIGKFPLGHVQIELEAIKQLEKSKKNEDKIIKIHEMDKQRSEDYYTKKFFIMMCNPNFNEFIVDSTYYAAWIPDKWMRMTEGYLICEKEKVNNGKMNIILYTFRRKYRK